MHVLTLATGTSDNSPHGYNLTFAFPMILFIVIAAGLYFLYRRPHRVPGHGELRVADSGAGGRAAGIDPGGVAEGEAARSAAVAAGLTTATGGGALESVHEPAGAHRAAGLPEGSGNVSQDQEQAAAAGPGTGEVPAAGPPSDEDEASE